MPKTTRTQVRRLSKRESVGLGRNRGVRTRTHLTVGAGSAGTSSSNELLLPSLDPFPHGGGHGGSNSNLTPRTRRYYCHACDSRMDNVSPDFTCPACSTGFVQDNQSQNNFPTPGGGGAEDEDEEPELGPEPESHTYHPNRTRRYAGNYFSGGRATESQAPTPTPPTPPPPTEAQQIEPPSLPEPEPEPRAFIPIHLIPLHSRRGVIIQGRSRPVNLTLSDALLLTQRIADGLAQNPHFGPPPLSARRLKELKRVAVSEGDVKAKSQCCVCLQEFVLEESVTRLNCSHIYHNVCIVSWLELHGTCPLCRNDMTENQSPPRGSGPGPTSSFIITRQRPSAQDDPNSMIQPPIASVNLERIRELLRARNLERATAIAASTSTSSSSSTSQPPVPVPVERPASLTWEEVWGLPSRTGGSGPSASNTESRRPGRRYQKEEGQAILDFIVERDLFESTGDNGIWLDMEMASVGNHRSFQSLKEHFRKTVLPKLNEYNISARNTRRLQGFSAGAGRGTPRVRTRAATARATREATTVTD